MRDIVDSMHIINMKLTKSVSYCKNTKIFNFPYYMCGDSEGSGGTAQIQSCT